MTKKENTLLTLANQFIVEEVSQAAKTGEGMEDAVVSLNMPTFQFVTGQSKALNPKEEAYDEDAKPFTFRIANAPAGSAANLGAEAVVQFLKCLKVVVYKEYNPTTKEFDTVAIEPAPDYLPQRQKFSIGENNYSGRVIVREGRQVQQAISTEYRVAMRVLTVGEAGAPVWVTALAYMSSYRENNFRDFLANLKKKQGEEALFSRLWKVTFVLGEGKGGGSSYQYQFTALGAANEALVEEARELYFQACDDLKLCLRPMQPQAVAITGGTQEIKQMEVLPAETTAIPGPPPALNLY